MFAIDPVVPAVEPPVYARRHTKMFSVSDAPAGVSPAAHASSLAASLLDIVDRVDLSPEAQHYLSALSR
jgi:hypothetical protein